MTQRQNPVSSSISSTQTGSIKERPILFSAPMVRAILDGRKTQTRRIVKPQPPTVVAVAAKAGCDYGWFTDHVSPGRYRVSGPVWAVRELGGPTELRCPYGVAGDRLWVRETWAPADRMYQGHDLDEPRVIAYPADRSALHCFASGKPTPVPANDLASWNWDALKGKPSIHMSRWMSRILLEVEAVCVELLHDIGEDDAKAEGVTPFLRDEEGGDIWSDGTHRTAFNFLWNEINGWSPNSFDSNPWVWVVTFRRVQ